MAKGKFDTVTGVESNRPSVLDAMNAEDFKSLDESSRLDDLYEKPTTITGKQFEAAAGADYETVSDLIGSNFAVENQDVRGMLGEAQGVGSQLAGFLSQAVVGEIAGGTIEGVGYLLDLQHWTDRVAGEEGDWGNWLSDIGSDLKEGTREAVPIFTKEQGGKALGMSSKTTSWMANGIGQAIVSRHMENMMEAKGVFDEEMALFRSEGIDEDTAKKLAGDAASFTYKGNWAMLLQDIPQYLLLGVGGKTSKAIDSKALAEVTGTSVAKALGNKSRAIFATMLSEGAEESYQFMLAEEAKHMADVKSGLKKESSFGSRLGKYSQDGDMWTAATFGALGAGMMQTVGPAINRTIFSKDVSDTERRVSEVNSRAARLAHICKH